VTVWKEAPIENEISDSKGFYPTSIRNGFDEKDTDIYTKPPKDQYGNEAPKKFRVPDLRHMFIASCQIYKNMSEINSMANQFETSDKNITGTYTPDTLPRGITPETVEDNHFHFIAYGTNGMQYESVCQTFTANKDIGVQQVAKYAKGWNPKLDDLGENKDRKEKNPKLVLND
jgi:hypothetical protein